MAAAKLNLDIVSDVMCPWCYIGKRRLEAVGPLVNGIELDVRWRPFLLDPTIPAGGMDRQAYLDRKFGRAEGRDIYRRIRETGESVGIAFDFPAIARSPNTINAHRLIRWAATAGCQDAVVEQLFQLYFTEGVDIGDPEVLVAIAAEAGMDGDLVRQLLDGDDDIDLVRREVELAHAMGVTGVPAFIFAGKYLVAGAQDPTVLAEVIQKAAEEDTGADQPTHWA